MNKKKRLRQARTVLLVFCSLLLGGLAKENYMASASSYNNAKEFYHSTGQANNGKHIDVTNGMIYFATQAKTASTSSKLRYVTLGFDITLTGGGKSVSFAVKRGGSLTELVEARRTAGGYEYLLYCISTEDIISLAKSTGNANADTVLSASVIGVRMDAIMTTKKNGINQGSISENGSGGLHETKPVYHLNNASHLRDIKDIFSGHTFDSYKKIEDELDNYTLSIYYSAGDSASVGNGYSKGTYKIGGMEVYNAIYSSGKVFTDGHKLMETFYLKSPSDFGLSKTGYHIDSGKEWKTASSVLYTPSKLYSTKQVDPEVGYRNKGLVLYANWQPNTYTIAYNANGGLGSMSSTSMIYDTEKSLQKNTFVRDGYIFYGWNTKSDGTGNAYTDQINVKNLATSGTITLYAQWKPCVYKITTDKQGGSGGTDIFWEKMDTGFYSNPGCTNTISKITIPNKKGYDFLGYYSWINGGGKLLLDSTGGFAVTNSYFINDEVVFADWKPKNYTITFDKQGGSQGSDTVVAIYDSDFPFAEGPIKEGYRFMGYFTELNGAGTQIYNEFMISDEIYQYDHNITLYAHWIDDVLPEVTLSVSNDKWTNEEVILTAEAVDYGTGLKSIEIYQIGVGESEILVAQAIDLDEKKTSQLSFTNTTEGVIRYKAIATDMEGNTAESYNAVLYDTTAPDGEVVAVQIDGTTFYFDINITDINTGD